MMVLISKVYHNLEGITGEPCAPKGASTVRRRGIGCFISFEICTGFLSYYRNRRRIEEHDEQLRTIAKQMASFDLIPASCNHQESHSVPAFPISSNQAQILKDLVKKKGKNKKGMFKIWSQFKRRFDLTRYVHLPEYKFEEALQWLKQLEI